MPDAFMEEDDFFADAENTLGVEKVEEIQAEAVSIEKEFAGEIQEMWEVTSQILQNGWRTVDDITAFAFVYGVMQGRRFPQQTPDDLELDLEIDLDFGDEDEGLAPAGDPPLRGC